MRVTRLTFLFSLLAVTSMARAQRPPMSEEERERTRVRIGITKEQQAQIDLLWQETGRQTKEVNDRMNELRRQLNALYEVYNFDRRQAAAIRKDMVNLHARRSQIFADNQERLRKILTRDQFDRLTAMIKEMHEKMHQKWEGRPHGPGGPPGPSPGEFR